MFGAEIWVSTSAIDCICKLALWALAGRTGKRKHIKTWAGGRVRGCGGVQMAEQCVSIFRTQRAISLLSCLFYSKCHSVSESVFRALRQRCRCTGMKYLQPRPNGVGFTRASGLSKISRRPSAKKSELLKSILTHCAAEGHCQISFSILPTIWMLLLKKALQ